MKIRLSGLAALIVLISAAQIFAHVLDAFFSKAHKLGTIDRLLEDKAIDR